MPYVLILLFFIQILVIFFTTRSVTNALFNLFYRFTRSSFLASWLLAIIYLPGTLVHELSHFLTAAILMLPVKELNLLPDVQRTERGYYVKLGHVIFGHKDFFRTALVGVAPFIVGLGALYSIFAFDLFPTDSLVMNIVWAYLLFSFTSSMFSSKKDMEGTLIFVPILALMFSLAIGFRVDITTLLNSDLVQQFLLQMNIYLAYGSVSNFALYLITYAGIRRR